MNGISRCIVFAAKYGLSVVIDLQRDDSGVRLPPESLFQLNRKYMQAVRLGTESATNLERASFESQTMRQLPRRDSGESIYVFNQSGGGQDHWPFFTALRLTDRIASQVVEQANLVPPFDSAVHLRFTDAQIELSRCLDELGRQVRGSRVFVASDSAVALEAAKDRWRHVEVVSQTIARSENEEGLHSRGLSHQQAVDVLADLYLLSRAPRLVSCGLGGSRVRIPGLTRLAETLRAYPKLRTQFFGDIPTK